MKFEDLSKLDKQQLIDLILKNCSGQFDLKKMVDSTCAVVVVTDIDGNIEYVNPRFCQETGYSRKEVLGQNPRILKSGIQSADFYKELWGTISAGKDWIGQFHNKKKNGDIFWELASISPVFSDEGEITHYISIKEDITYLMDFQAQLQSMNETKEKIISIIAHDLNTPIISLLSFLNILQEDIFTQAPEEIDKMLNEVKASVNATVDLVERILDWARNQGGNISLIREDVDFLELVMNTFNALSIAAAQKNIKLEYDSEQFCIVKSDKFMMETILRNLVNNAVKFSGFNGVVKVKVEKGKNEWIFSVIDFGVGITAEKAEEIFNGDRRISTRGTNNKKGAGLGLLLCREFVSRHNGTISAAPGKEGGTVVKYTIPF